MHSCAARPLRNRMSVTNFPMGAVLFFASVGLRSCSSFVTPSYILSRSLSTSDKTPTRKYKKSPIYTRTGDKGTSSLYNGERRAKADEVFHVLGDQDELNAVIGIALEYCISAQNDLEDKLIEIQSRLFDLGAAVATPAKNSSETKLLYTKFRADHTQDLERWIDELDSQLPKITNFVLPSGGLAATHLNLARTICRRAEREVVPMIAANTVDQEVGKYLNRLSDFLFVASRFASMKEQRQETIWRKAGIPFNANIE